MRSFGGWFARVVLVFLVLCGVGVANDGFGALGAGGIIIGKTNDIAMAKEALDISYDKIKVDYEFVNESDKDITETIVFPLPPIAVGEKIFKDHASYLGIIDGFKVVVNGKSVKFTTKVRAVQNGVDVTDKLKKIGFSDYDIVMAEDRFDEIIEPKIKILKANGLWSDDNILWKNYVTYEWMQTFKKHTRLHISHSYSPLISAGMFGSYTSNSDAVIQDYCISQEAKKKLDTIYNNQGYALWGTVVEYVLKTANTWKDGIRDFTLIVRTKSPKETVSTCYPKNLQQVSDGIYRLKLKNFKPEHDLKIYFGNIKNGTGRLYNGVSPIFVK